MNIDRNIAYRYLTQIIDKYLKNDIEKNKIPEELGNYLSIADVSESDDMLLNESFHTLFHMNEIGCDVSRSELEYLRKCLVGDHLFSREERDQVIQITK